MRSHNCSKIESFDQFSNQTVHEYGRLNIKNSKDYLKKTKIFRFFKIYGQSGEGNTIFLGPNSRLS